MSSVIVAVHVVLAVFVVGPMTYLPMLALRHLRTGDAAGAAGFARPVLVLSGISLAVVLVGFAALGMKPDAAYAADWSFGSTWVWGSLLAYAIALGLTVGVVVPALRDAAPGSAGPAAGGAAGTVTRSPVYGRVAAASGVATLLLVVVVVLMTTKP